MAALTATGERPGIIPSVPDVRKPDRPRSQRYLRSDEVVLDRVRQDCDERGIRWDGRAHRRANSLVLVMNMLQAGAAHAQQPHGRASYAQWCLRLFPPGTDWRVAKRSIKRWIRDLERFGWVETRPFTVGGGGKSAGVDWWLVPIGSEPSARSSAG